MSRPDVKRFALPAAHADPAFQACLTEAISTPEFVAQFDRLYGTELRAGRPPSAREADEATGNVADDMREFVHFVHQGMYLTLSNDAVLSLRAGATEQ